jgi:hypothetical protein
MHHKVSIHVQEFFKAVFRIRDIWYGSGCGCVKNWMHHCIIRFSLMPKSSLKQCCGSVTFWYLRIWILGSVPLTNGSGCESGRPNNIRIRITKSQNSSNKDQLSPHNPHSRANVKVSLLPEQYLCIVRSCIVLQSSLLSYGTLSCTILQYTNIDICLPCNY